MLKSNISSYQNSMICPINILLNLSRFLGYSSYRIVEILELSKSINNNNLIQKYYDYKLDSYIYKDTENKPSYLPQYIKRTHESDCKFYIYSEIIEKIPHEPYRNFYIYSRVSKENFNTGLEFLNYKLQKFIYIIPYEFKTPNLIELKITSYMNIDEFKKNNPNLYCHETVKCLIIYKKCDNDDNFISINLKLPNYNDNFKSINVKLLNDNFDYIYTLVSMNILDIIVIFYYQIKSNKKLVKINTVDELRNYKTTNAASYLLKFIYTFPEIRNDKILLSSLENYYDYCIFKKLCSLSFT